NKAYDIFIKYISEDFRMIQTSTPHEYINLCWNNYMSKSTQYEQTPILRNIIFRKIVTTCLYRENILPMFLKSQATSISDIIFDIMLYSDINHSPISITTSLNLRERYKQADLEAVALKYVHHNAENYLISFDSNEADTVKQNMKTGSLLGIDRIIAADTKEFDELIAELKNRRFINPGNVPIITGTLIE
ncbi:MAG: hypothetical protein K6G20_09355, partial [Ruminococcus sp.]|nr:hypothetical protein [Ruminococcus sp.]